MSGDVVMLVGGSDREVVESIADDVRDLLEGLVVVEIVGGVAEAMTTVEAVRAAGGIVPLAFVAVDVDDDEGIDVVLALHADDEIERTRKVLITSRASLQRVDIALQRGAVHGMLTRPWTRHGLHRLVDAHLATFLVEYAPERLDDFGAVIDDAELERARTRVEQERAAPTAAAEAEHPLLDSDVDDAAVEAQMVRLLDRALGHPPRLRVAPGTILIESGEDVGGIYVVLEGIVQLTSLTEQGERILHEDSTGRILGLLSLASHRRAMLRCKAVTDVRAIPVSVDQLARAIDAEPALAGLLTRVLIGSLARRLRRSDELQVELDQSLAALSEARAQLVASARFATLGEMSAGMAHELNNPTAALTRAVEHLADDLALVVGDPEIVDRVHRQLDAPSQSTSEQRAHRRSLADRLGDRRLAERLVGMGVTEPREAQALARLDGSTLDRLEAAARLGRTIRNTTSAAERIRSLVDSLRAYARGDDGRGPVAADVDVAEGVDNALRLVSHRLDDVEVERHVDDVPSISARPGALQQVWTNLITNALDAVDDHGRIELRVSQAAPRTVRVEVIDDGPGIPTQLQSRIFEPRFTTKNGRVQFGLGLGLSIARQIVEEHHGSITVESRPGRTRFAVVLPVEGSP